MIKRVGILTSGGDSPGMNNAIRSVARTAFSNGIKVSIIKNGYKGLVENDIHDSNHQTFSNIINRGGTFIRTARLPEFKNFEVRQIAHKNLKNKGIDSLVVIGGDGTYQGAKKLSEEGLNCIAIPGTIDNDIISTDYTIGFDTAVNTIANCVDKIRDTIYSHSSCCIIEVMGRHCGDLAIYASVSTGADILSSSDNSLSEEEIIKQVKTQQKEGKSNLIIIVSENIYNVQELAKNIQTSTNIQTRAVILGHIQRGGSPSAMDRILGSRLGTRAIELLIEGKTNRCVGIKGNKIVDYSIEDKLISSSTKNLEELINIQQKTK